MITVRKKVVKILGDILVKLCSALLALVFIGGFTFLISILPVSMIADTEYTSTERDIYGVWYIKYYNEVNSGKTRTTQEINRYYYKTKSGSTYSDNWTSYGISDFTIIDDKEKEYIKMERLRYKNKWLDKVYDTPIKENQTIAHYFIHKNTAKDLGIKVK